MQQCTQQLSWNPAALGSRLYRASKEIVFKKSIKSEKYLHLKTCDVVWFVCSTNNVANPNLKKSGVYNEICAVNRKDIVRGDVVLQKSKMTEKTVSIKRGGGGGGQLCE